MPLSRGVLMFRPRRFDPMLHMSIASIMTGFAALILSLHGWSCRPPLPPPPAPPPGPAVGPLVEPVAGPLVEPPAARLSQ